MDISLRRDIFSDEATLGRITCGDWSWYSIELPWMGGANLIGESAVLPGKYEITLYYSPHIGSEVLLLHGVPGRSFVEIHVGNRASDLKGCIAPGMSRGEDCVNRSVAAYSLLYSVVRGAILRGERVWIEITNEEPIPSDSGSSARA